MRAGLHRALLRVFRRLPTTVRRLVVRVLSPSFTVGAVVFIERADGALLLVGHVYRRRWGVPGGLLEKGEAPAAAAVREVQEEVGIEVVLIGDPAVVVDPVPQRVDLVFRARLAPGVDPADARPVSPEITEVGWFQPHDLPQLQHETASAFVALARNQQSMEPGPAADLGRAAR
jgi:8-oxo-dGTP pyrophosphatase MutT (NUDIX family)